MFMALKINANHFSIFSDRAGLRKNNSVGNQKPVVDHTIMIYDNFNFFSSYT